MQYIESVHIDNIEAGDTIIHNGIIKTICQNDISENSFTGKTIFGDSYNIGNKKVSRVKFPRNNIIACTCTIN